MAKKKKTNTKRKTNKKQQNKSKVNIEVVALASIKCITCSINICKIWNNRRKPKYHTRWNNGMVKIHIANRNIHYGNIYGNRRRTKRNIVAGKIANYSVFLLCLMSVMTIYQISKGTLKLSDAWQTLCIKSL